MERKHRVLVAEDNEAYRSACESFLSGRPDIEPVYAGDCASAIRAMALERDEGRLDGAVVDCFFPYGSEEGAYVEGMKAFYGMYMDVKGDSNETAALKKVSLDAVPGMPLQMPWLPDNYKPLFEAVKRGEPEDQMPFGYVVARTAREMGFPVVMATSTYHHDGMTQLIVHWAGKAGIPLIDCGQGRPEEKAAPEFWERAFGSLERQFG